MFVVQELESEKAGSLCSLAISCIRLSGSAVLPSEESIVQHCRIPVWRNNNPPVCLTHDYLSTSQLPSSDWLSSVAGEDLTNERGPGLGGREESSTASLKVCGGGRCRESFRVGNLKSGRQQPGLETARDLYGEFLLLKLSQ